ncbi:hypothetical protein OM427_08505 [Halomonas sp. 18H]|uniref:hypothetical protein n=1 Tax=Halomonas almeriensis TaxID=308163 RepID=UPI00223017BE|nr:MULTISPECIES: hypothetical protein [Halomonas]MCW4149568.1 hypothetical protein [Halomonas sp. 18H]MDN3553486.1 hypothetical protein [Halomonas almeriensis]
MKASWRLELLEAQLELARQATRSVVLVVTGHAAAGKAALINELNHRLENRLTEVHALVPSSEDRERPYWWRYWRRLPARGRLGVFVHGWYGDALFARADQRLGPGGFADRLAEIGAFEAELAAEGVTIIKVWMDIEPETQGEHIKNLWQDPEQAWQVKDHDWQRHLQHALIEQLGSEMRAATDATHAPWYRLSGGPGTQPFKQLARHLVAAITAPLGEPPAEPPEATQHDVPSLKHLAAEHRGALDKSDYRQRLAEAQARLARNARELQQRRIPMVLVFEGQDAAGKGGSIHRLTSALDARQYRVHQIGPPSDEELAHPWAWRFWRRLPLDGRIAIFDRSWYGRVLVERVEGLVPPDAWQRAYVEICRFERQLLAHGAVLGKLFLAIDKDEQKQRFEARAATPHKRHKLTEEDWRNRERWADYCQAIDDVFLHTHQHGAAWALIDANDKRRARIDVLEDVNCLMEKRLLEPR